MKIRGERGSVEEVEVLKYFNFWGLKFAVHHHPYMGLYIEPSEMLMTVSEYTTGARVAEGLGVAPAIRAAQETLRKQGRKATVAAIKAAREHFGRAN